MKTSTLRLLSKLKRLSKREGWSRSVTVQMLIPLLGYSEAEKQVEAMENKTLKGKL